MITVCAWCTTYGRMPFMIANDGQQDGLVSHGICMQCDQIERAYKEWQRTRPRTANGITIVRDEMA